MTMEPSSKRHEAGNGNKNDIGNGVQAGYAGKKQILLNAFDMSTVGHLSPGQWKVCLKILT